MSEQTTRTPAATGDAGEFAVPSLFRRMAALMVDWILCLLVTALVSNPWRNPWVPAVLVLEYAFFIGLFAQTPGMFFVRIRCVSFATGKSIGVLRAALRGLLLCLVIPSIIMDDDRRGLHDRAAGSVMINA